MTHHPPATLAPPLSLDDRAAALADALAANAVARDRDGGHAAAERELIRASGLLDLTTPARHGGLGGDWVGFYRVLQRIAQADSALAHLFAFHHLQVASILLFGSERQQERLLSETTAQRLFWGNALNPNDRRALAREVEGGYRIRGPKSYCSGSVGSDRLTLSAWHEPSQSFLIAVAPTRAPGVTVNADWDAFGQRQTDSGTVEFDDLFVPTQDVLVPPGTPQTPQATLRAQIAQLILAHLYLGIATGALNEASQFAREFGKPWFAAGVGRAVDDPYLQHRFGELHLLVRPAAVLAAEAARQVDAAFREGAALGAQQRGETAIAVAEAKVLAHRAAVEVSSQMFELTGARSTSSRLGLDRFWRNARVHTLHDPVDYKLRDIGRYVLERRLPDPTPYS